MEGQTGVGKNRISVIVDDMAKKNYVNYQTKEGIKTRDDAIENILHNIPIWLAQEERIKILTADLEKARQRIAELESSIKSEV